MPLRQQNPHKMCIKRYLMNRSSLFLVMMDDVSLVREVRQDESTNYALRNVLE